MTIDSTRPFFGIYHYELGVLPIGTYNKYSDSDILKPEVQEAHLKMDGEVYAGAFLTEVMCALRKNNKRLMRLAIIPGKINELFVIEIAKTLLFSNTIAQIRIVFPNESGLKLEMLSQQAQEIILRNPTIDALEFLIGPPPVCLY